MTTTIPKPRICVVNYLNTVPLVWGLLHGPQREACELKFCLPSQCADLLATGGADIGIVSSIEGPRQGLAYVKGLGIASRGPVLSILLATKKPLSEIRTLAGDTSSRTSVVLAQIILARKYGARPRLILHAPDLAAMMSEADAALIIGDPALHIDPTMAPYQISDLGAEWTGMTGLPMVYAVWAGPEKAVSKATAELLRDSYHYGRERMEEIVAQEAVPRGFDAALGRNYLTRNIQFELDESCREGMQLFFRYAAELDLI